MWCDKVRNFLVSEIRFGEGFRLKTRIFYSCEFENFTSDLHRDYI